ncbi:MAG: ROK family protein [Clostridia bacterium]|nr:ROK family protein [Clostridia bacterium]
MEKNYLAVDLGGSKYIVGILSESGKILCQKTHRWTKYTLAAIDWQIKNAVRDMLAAQPDVQISAAGMTIPGLADPKNGIWLSTDFMGIKNYPIAEELSKEFGLSFSIDNDGKACVLAERYFGAGKDCDDFLYMTVSNGIGGGLFLDGKLYRGAFGNAGEIGQFVVVENGRMSEDGTAGTLEMYAAAAGLVQNYVEAGGSATIDGKPADGKSIAAQAAAGGPAALRAFQLEGYYLGKAIAAAHNIIDFKKVILGGGLSLAFNFYKESLNNTVEEQTYKRAYKSPEVLPTPLGYEGALYGAATLAIINAQ